MPQPPVDEISPNYTPRANNARDMGSLQAKLSEALELQGYYQKMAEDYRAKYLALDREHQMLKHTHELDIENIKQEHKKKTDQVADRLQFEQLEATRKIEQATNERDQQIDNLIEDSKLLQSRLIEADRDHAKLREQIKQLANENRRQLEDIAAIKSEKEEEASQMRTEFRQEKDLILERASKEKSKLNDKMREMQIMTDK